MRAFFSVRKPVMLMMAVVAFLLTGSAVSGQRPNNAPNVAILVFDNVQIIDFAAPWEVLAGAGCKVYTVSQTKKPVKTIYGMNLNPDYDFTDCPQPDILLVPGGGSHTKKGTSPFAEIIPTEDTPELVDWVKNTAAKSSYVMSICNGAFILGRVGLLDGLSATTTEIFLSKLQTLCPNTKVVDDRRFVDNGKIITSGGLSSGIDAALHLVEKMKTRDQAQALALGLEYVWNPEGNFSMHQLANKYTFFNYKGFDDKSITKKWSSIEKSGDARQWTNKWEIVTGYKPKEILERINSSIDSFLVYRPETTRWRADPSRKNSDTESHWVFSDEKNNQWQGTINVKPVSDKQETYILSMHITKI